MQFSKTFTDALAREWTVELSTAVLRRLSQPPLSFRLEEAMNSKIDPKDPTSAVEKYQAWLDDDLRFGEVLFGIIKPDADRLGITQEQFEEGLKGAANQRAILAWHAAFTDFSQAPRKTLLRSLQIKMVKSTEFHEIAGQKIETEGETMTTEKMTGLIDGAIRHVKQEQDAVLANLADPF